MSSSSESKGGSYADVPHPEDATEHPDKTVLSDSDDSHIPCRVCKDLSSSHYPSYLLLKLSETSVGDCDICAMLLAGINAAGANFPEPKRYFPVTVNLKNIPHYGPLRVDIRTQDSPIRLQFYTLPGELQ